MIKRKETNLALWSSKLLKCSRRTPLKFPLGMIRKLKTEGSAILLLCTMKVLLFNVTSTWVLSFVTLGFGIFLFILKSIDYFAIIYQFQIQFHCWRRWRHSNFSQCKPIVLHIFSSMSPFLGNTFRCCFFSSDTLCTWILSTLSCEQT